MKPDAGREHDDPGRSDQHAEIDPPVTRTPGRQQATGRGDGQAEDEPHDDRGRGLDALMDEVRGVGKS